MKNRVASIAYAEVRKVRELGSTVRAKREHMGLGLVEAAGLAGVGVRFLSELERGKPTAQLGKTIAVLEAMGLVLMLKPRRPKQ